MASFGKAGDTIRQATKDSPETLQRSRALKAEGLMVCALGRVHNVAGGASKQTTRWAQTWSGISWWSCLADRLRRL